MYRFLDVFQLFEFINLCNMLIWCCCLGVFMNGAYFRLLWFIVDILVKNIDFHLMSVMYVKYKLFFCDWHDPSFQQTAKDETAYTQVSDKPDDSSQTATTQPKRNGSYIAMSPVEAQKCWSLFCLPRLRKGVWEQHMGVVLQWVGFTHSGCILCYLRDGGGGGGVMDTSSTKCWLCFSHRALSWLCPCPLCPTCLCKTKPFTNYALGWPKTRREPRRVQPGQTFHSLLVHGTLFYDQSGPSNMA